MIATIKDGKDYEEIPKDYKYLDKIKVLPHIEMFTISENNPLDRIEREIIDKVLKLN